MSYFLLTAQKKAHQISVGRCVQWSSTAFTVQQLLLQIRAWRLVTGQGLLTAIAERVLPRSCCQVKAIYEVRKLSHGFIDYCQAARVLVRPGRLRGGMSTADNLISESDRLMGSVLDVVEIASAQHCNIDLQPYSAQLHLQSSSDI